MLQRFSIKKDKIYIQKHGTKNLDYESNNYKLKSISNKIVKKVENYNKIFLFIGNMFYNKGVDRLIEFWQDIEAKDSLLIVAGRKRESYKELIASEEFIKNKKNIIYIDKFISENLFNYFMEKCNCILLPYRDASMSGVIFSAARFKKTILCTDVGAFDEYVVNGETGFIVSNKNKEYKIKLKEIIESVNKKELFEMGKKNYEYINEICSWDKIAYNLINNVYVD